ncbi:methylcrotonoyl-CoA carboxylase alpha chain mitochondrial precursor [Echria macrotheca]|uniref:Methylcrotonoyl-CoA carboxylase alpha chain mitochondrial n=1 Tax=Echria macrotheca TaxID=438768 RepID=A0AAJ0F946_9PEZI|nr:methylcrotonoyl-CoA carboxylase alpha chain mitochondrial precursor [Echria macrotheca]
MRSIKRTSRRLRVPSLGPAPRFFAPTATHGAAPSSSSSGSSPVTPITSLLIANRGEIALRIARTAAAMGIRTTTLYTDVDAKAQHARCTPYSLSLGPQSGAYLDGPRIVALARQHGIQALHPGYGFLSENPAFAQACEDAGIVFVGPPARAMADMGDKARSKEIMTAAGVPCVPGYHGPEQGVEQLKARAREIQFPVLLKSVKGGGGKGMRIVRTEDEFEAQLGSARAEARASFGEGGEVMLVEKYVVRPRHVEVQVFADRHGNCVALGERDCSVQRRHQKILEESPAPVLDDVTRKDLWDKARTAALAVGYVGAGTVEFILDRDTGAFYFMEMNTRLQVEHPVSEMVTGTDLVEWQFRVAAGEKLPLTQEEIEQRIAERGAAIEARIYAENPEKGFFPDSGKLVHLATPTTSADVRIDAGFVEGDTVSEAYDGMIAKLIVRGRDRETAIRKMELALREYEVVGLSTNIEFLKRLCRSQAFIEGDVETGFIDKWRDELFKPKHITDEAFAQAALGLLGGRVGKVVDGTNPHGATLGFGEAREQSERVFAFRVRDDTSAEEGEVVKVAVTQRGNALFDVSVSRPGGSEPVVFENIISEPAALSDSGIKTKLTTYFASARLDSTLVKNPANEDHITLFQLGEKTELQLVEPAWFEEALGLKEAAASVVAPMPCKILRNEVKEGDVVEKGAALVVIESMKMETVIRSPQSGVIKKLAHKEGDICKAGTVLVLFEDAQDAAGTGCLASDERYEEANFGMRNHVSSFQYLSFKNFYPPRYSHLYKSRRTTGHEVKSFASYLPGRKDTGTRLANPSWDRGAGYDIRFAFSEFMTERLDEVTVGVGLSRRERGMKLDKQTFDLISLEESPIIVAFSQTQPFTTVGDFA